MRAFGIFVFSILQLCVVRGTFDDTLSIPPEEWINLLTENDVVNTEPYDQSEAALSGAATVFGSCTMYLIVLGCCLIAKVHF